MAENVKNKKIDNSAKVKSGIVKALLYIFLILLAVVCTIPFLLMIVNSTRSGNEIMTSFSLIPGSSFAANWKVIMDNMSLGRGLLNSLFLAVKTT